MGLSYNPSSFATNKTILQAIEELKRYLMANPLACIYELSGNADPNVLTYSLSSVIVPDGQELKDGDILLSDNGYYAFIDEVGENDVTVLQWTLVGSHITSMTLTSSVVSVESTPIYLTGWIYRANAWTSDRYRILSYDLTLTYEDESMFPSTQVQSFTLPLQSINAIWYYLESDNSTTIYVDVNKDDGTNEVNSFSIPAGIPGQDGADGQNGVSVVGATIDGSNHLILTLSDGNTIDAGLLPTPNEYTHSVAISSTSGTFTDDEFAKLGYGDSTIVYTDAYSVSTVYKLKIETASILEFESIDASSRQNLKLIDVNKTTKAFSSTGISMITSATFDSGTATAGKVLTANGSGGTSWETPSGSGTQIVVLSGTSGTLSNDDYNKVNGNDCLIQVSHDLFYKIRDESWTIIYSKLWTNNYGSYQSFETQFITITKSTQGWVKSSGFLFSNDKIKSSQINSQSATNGQVLTADGSGGASWQSAGGGGTQLYEHCIYMWNNSPVRKLFVNIISSSSTPITSVNDFISVVSTEFSTNAGTTCSGQYGSNQPIVNISNVGSGDVYVGYLQSGSYTSSQLTVSIFSDINDNVRTL